jgi:hypothetical protein
MRFLVHFSTLHACRRCVNLNTHSGHGTFLNYAVKSIFVKRIAIHITPGRMDLPTLNALERGERICIVIHEPEFIIRYKKPFTLWGIISNFLRII